MNVAFKYDLPQDVTARGLSKLLTALGLSVSKKVRDEMIVVSHRTRRARINALLKDAVASGVITVDEETGVITVPSKAKKMNEPDPTFTVEPQYGVNDHGPWHMSEGVKVYDDPLDEHSPRGRALCDIVDGRTTTRTYMVIALHKALDGRKIVTHLQGGNKCKTKFYPSLAAWGMTEATLETLTGDGLYGTRNHYQGMYTDSRSLTRLVVALRARPDVWCLTVENVQRAIEGQSLEFDPLITGALRAARKS
jgi:hypothetical protein